MPDEHSGEDRRKAPAYQHYAKTWLVATAHLSLEEQGAYQRLLDHQWVDGALPESERDRARLLGVTVTTFRRIWRRIGQFFPGGLNPRLEEVRTEQQAYRDRQQAAGRRSADRRAARLADLSLQPEGNQKATTPQPEVNQPGSSAVDERSQPEGNSSTCDLLPTPALPKSTALVARSATAKLSVPVIVEQLQNTALQTRLRESAATKRDVFVGIVFAYWATKLGHEKTLLDAKRKATLRARFVENGDDLSELLYVVDGALRDDWTMGRDPRSTKRYDGIETIYQDRAHVEKFAAMCSAWKKGERHPMAVKYGEAA